VKDPIGMEIQEAIEELKKDRFNHGSRYWVALRLRVVMNDLKKVMLGVFEYHKDTLFLEDDFNKVNKIWMGEFGA
jgi:hypothetical protein